MLSDLLFQLQSWPICYVFLNGASLHDHEQMNFFNLASYYLYEVDALIGKRAKYHGNLGSKKLRTDTLQATAKLQILLESTAYYMPYKLRT